MCDLQTDHLEKAPGASGDIFRASLELLFRAILRGISSEVCFGGASAGNVHSDLLLHDALHASALHGQLLIGDGG